ncbi:uncharacterized protein LOC121426910 [Lytechinus variegatus]|uniref:uncharacterized protein LOC121426910 n=1 Tax=Lytechinus variegatus TaxID=7654 RepID=UPI001BB1C47A|nr:uncharacterized protein LOC121426910 [Lytechinus variegatus]
MFITPLLISQLPVLDCQVSCPTGWINRPRYCYKFYNDRLSWRLAGEQCKFDGGFLTSIVDRHENDFLVESFRNLTSLAWIGMDSTGLWLDGSSSQGFSNGFRYETLSTSRCSVINLEQNGTWNVLDCLASRLNFICKKNQDRGHGDVTTDTVNGEDEDTIGSPTGLSRSLLVFLCLCSVVAITCIGGCISSPIGTFLAKCLWECLLAICKIMADTVIGFFGWVYEWLCILGLAIQLCFIHLYRCFTCKELRRKRRERRERTPPEPETQEPLRAPLASVSTAPK